MDRTGLGLLDPKLLDFECAVFDLLFERSGFFLAELNFVAEGLDFFDLVGQFLVSCGDGQPRVWVARFRRSRSQAKPTH